MILGGLGGTAVAPTTSSLSKGLGGVDPKTSGVSTGATGSNGKPGYVLLQS